MAQEILTEWMEVYESLTESEIHTYSSEQENNHEVMLALYELLGEPYRYKNYKDLLDGVCEQLLAFYRSGEVQLKKFAMQFMPNLVFLHLMERSITAVPTLLVSLYNLEVIDLKGQPQTISFRVPSIAQSSVYHDSSHIEPTFLDPNALRRWEECNSKLVSWGPLPQVECLNAQNRQRVTTALIFLYNQQLGNVCTQGLEYTLKGISRLVSQGFHSSGSARSSMHSDSSYSQNLVPRVAVSSPLLLELLQIVYHGAERGVSGAVQALHDVLQRANYEIYADVILTANAIRNLIQHIPSSAATPRPSQGRGVSKSMITNASFRTKKLPDDIPIQEQHQGEVPLDSITEEQEDPDKVKSKGSVSALKHLPKQLAGFGKNFRSKTTHQGQEHQLEMSANVGGAGDQPAESPSVEGNRTLHVSAV